MKKTIIALAGITALLISSYAAADFKIGFVDSDRILRESKPAVDAQKKLEKEFASRDQDLQKVAKQVRDLQATLDKEGPTMGDAERAGKERDLNNLNRDFQRQQRELREDFNLRKNEEYATILDRVNKVIKTIAESEKFDLILQEAVYRSSKIDITDKVLKALSDTGGSAAATPDAKSQTTTKAPPAK